jgi:hypothetical protein
MQSISMLAGFAEGHVPRASGEHGECHRVNMNQIFA